MKRFLMTAIAVFSTAVVYALPADSNFGVGPQYDTTHVYVRPEDFDGFVASLLATFGGTTTKQGVFTVTPTPSQTMSQLVLTPVGIAIGFRIQDAGSVPVRSRAHGLSRDRPRRRRPVRRRPTAPMSS